MRPLVLSSAMWLIAAPAVPQVSDARAAIGAAMADSAEGWNLGDIERFLTVYSDDPATSFTTATGVERGKAGIRAKYLATYIGQFGADPSKRSRLSFDFVDVRLLGPDHALLIARWTLAMPRADKPQTGMTSLVLRKETGGWRIVADHS